MLSSDRNVFPQTTLKQGLKHPPSSADYRRRVDAATAGTRTHGIRGDSAITTAWTTATLCRNSLEVWNSAAAVWRKAAASTV